MRKRRDEEEEGAASSAPTIVAFPSLAFAPLDFCTSFRLYSLPAQNCHSTVRTNFKTAGGAALFSHTRLRGQANPKNLIRLVPA